MCELVNKRILTCTIGRVIIVPKHTQFFPPSDANLSNKWHEIVRYSLRIFANLSTGMSPDWIEVSEDKDIPRWVRPEAIPQNLFDEKLRSAVGVRRLKTSSFPQW